MEGLISVVIPAYNVAQYLKNCLDSVLQQTYPNIEILLVDDGSTDETGEIADRYQAQYPNKLRVIHTENQGVTKARFKGIQTSHGEWIGFVDGDDEIEPDMYERLYDNAVQYGVDISHCGHITIVNGGERVHEFYNTGRLLKQDKETGLRDFLEGKFEPGLWSKLYRRELLFQVLQKDVISSSIKYNEDVLMNYYLFSLANASVLEDFCGYHYLAREGSATRKGFQENKVLDPVRVRKQILEDVPVEYKDIAWKYYLTNCMNAYAALNNRAGYNGKSEELKAVLRDNKNKWTLLRRNDRIKLRIIMASPGLYERMYGFYEKYLQKKRYE